MTKEAVMFQVTRLEMVLANGTTANFTSASGPLAWDAVRVSPSSLLLSGEICMCSDTTRAEIAKRIARKVEVCRLPYEGSHLAMLSQS